MERTRPAFASAKPWRTCSSASGFWKSQRSCAGTSAKGSKMILPPEPTLTRKLLTPCASLPKVIRPLESGRSLASPWDAAVLATAQSYEGGGKYVKWDIPHSPYSFRPVGAGPLRPPAPVVPPFRAPSRLPRFRAVGAALAAAPSGWLVSPAGLKARATWR